MSQWSRRQRRAAFLLLLSAVGILALAPRDVRPKLLWNATASAPIGLYWVMPPASLAVGDLVIARPPAPAARLAAARKYLAAGVPLVKRVAAGPGMRVCAYGPRIVIAPALVIPRQRRDEARRILPWWEGCTRLGPGRVLLVMKGSPNSFDGRYFGPTPIRDIVGKAYPLWLL